VYDEALGLEHDERLALWGMEFPSLVGLGIHCPARHPKHLFSLVTSSLWCLVGPGRHCPPRHPKQCEPSLLESMTYHEVASSIGRWIVDGPMDSACHISGCHLSQETKVQMRLITWGALFIRPYALVGLGDACPAAFKTYLCLLSFPRCDEDEDNTGSFLVGKTMHFL